MSLFQRALARVAPNSPFLQREVPEGTLEQQFSRFWAENITGNSTLGWFSPRLSDRVWIANRCMQLNAQQIAGMPLRHEGTAGVRVPAWLSSPDPVWFPNGLSDALFAAVRSMYGWGDAFLLITSRYADEFPQSWTVLDPSVVDVQVSERGRRTYKVNEEEFDSGDIVQITRDPNPGQARGTSALRAYASQAWSAIAAGDLEQNVLTGGTIPHAVLKSQRKLTQQQAQAIQEAWVAARARYGSGVPAILPPDLELTDFANIPPKDLLLLEAQEWDARVIATAYGVPASLLNMAVTGGLTYQNPATLGEQWWRFELRPTAKRIADALTANMLPRGQAVTFDASDTFAPLLPAAASGEDDAQSQPSSQSANASPNSPNVTPLRPAQGGNT